MTVLNAQPAGKNRVYKEIIGLSTDNKPTDLAEGSSFWEIDTQTLYMFNSKTSTWVAQN